MKKTALLFTLLGFLCINSKIITVNAQPPSWLWAKSAGDASYDYAQSVTADSLGNSYVTGYFNMSITFDVNHTFFSNGSADLYIVKYDPVGNVIWVKSAGGNDFDISTSVAVDKLGNVYLTGYFKSSSLTFGSTTLVNAGGSSYDIFIVKYDPDGNVLWAQSIGGTGDDRGYCIAVDDPGNIFIAGYFFSPTIMIGTFTLTNNGFSDIFIAKYTTDGTALWVNSPVGPGWEYIYGVAVDHSGNSFIAGKLNGNTLTFGTIVLVKVANHDMFVAKYSSTGQVLWAKNAGVSGDNSSNFVAADIYGSCFVTGRFGGNSITFGSFTLTNAGNGDVFLVKYDVPGNVIWAKSAGGAQNDEAYSVTADKSGYIYAAGYFKSVSIDFGSNVLTNISSSGTADMFITEYDPDGNNIWALSAGGTGDEIAYSVAVDSLRNSFSAGYIGSSTVVFGNTTLSSNGSTDMFVAKTDNLPVSIKENQSSGDYFSVFPNPANDFLLINVPSMSSVEILNARGQVCKKLTNHLSETKIDISELTGGLYLIKVTKGNEILTSKFIKE